MRVDLHNHTTRCNHATGSMQAYVEKAIEVGIDIFGFTEHAPMEFDKYYRMGFEQLQEYFETIKKLQDRYKDKITILQALEVDFLPGYMDARVLDADVDYLIGSVHFLNEWGFDNPDFIGGYEDRDIDEIYAEYFKAIELMAQSKLFDVVGHLDLIKVFGYTPRGDVVKLAEDALKAIKESEMVIELNSAGLRKPIKQPYPGYELLKAAKALGIGITFGSDAHAVEQIGYGYEEVVALAKEVGYTQCYTFSKRKRQVVTF